MLYDHYEYYSSEGALLIQEFYDSDGRLKRQCNYVVNEYGDIIKADDSSIYWAARYTVNNVYTYDSHGNWVSKIRYESDKPEWPTIRSITYYD